MTATAPASATVERYSINPTQRDQLRERWLTSDHLMGDRFLAILACAWYNEQNGVTPQWLQERFGLPIGDVQRWIGQFQTGGIEGVGRAGTG